MIDVVTCEICGRLYNNPSGFFRVCPTCYENDENEFQKIKDYLNVHPCAKIFDVVADLNISIKQIKRYLRESRLESWKRIIISCCAKAAEKVYARADTATNAIKTAIKI